MSIFRLSLILQFMIALIFGAQSSFAEGQSILSMPKFSLEYSGSVNALEEERPRLYSHVLGASVGTNINGFAFVDVGIEASFISVGQEIEKNNDNPSLTDVHFDIAKQIVLNRRNAMTLAAYLALPTSEESRFEAYRAYLLNSIGLTTQIYKSHYDLSNTIAYGYLNNSFEVSPVSLESNPDHSIEYQLTNKFSFYRYARAIIGGGVKLQHYLNNESQIHWNESLALGYERDSWHTFLSFSNGSYDDQNRYDLWFIDQFRQVISLKVGYDF